MLNKKGYTLLEMLLALFIVLVMGTWLSTNLDLNFPMHVYALDYLQHQTDSMLYKNSSYLDDISFNSHGNVNQAKTIYKNQYKYIINLGMGRLKNVEK